MTTGTYQLTINADTLDELMAKLGAANAGGAVSGAGMTDDDLVAELRERMAKQGKTVVIRAQRNSKSKEAEKDEEPETEPDSAEPETEPDSAEPEQSEGVTYPENDGDFDAVMAECKAAVAAGAEPEKAAEVRRTFGKFLSENTHIKKLSDIKTREDQLTFLRFVRKNLPAVWDAAHEEVPF